MSLHPKWKSIRDEPRSATTATTANLKHTGFGEFVYKSAFFMEVTTSTRSRFYHSSVMFKAFIGLLLAIQNVSGYSQEMENTLNLHTVPLQWLHLQPHSCKVSKSFEHFPFTLVSYTHTQILAQFLSSHNYVALLKHTSMHTWVTFECSVLLNSLVLLIHFFLSFCQCWSVCLAAEVCCILGAEDALYDTPLYTGSAN